MSDPARDRLAMAAFPEMNPGPVVRTDLGGCIQLVNEAARRLFDRHVLVGEHWPQVCPQIDAEMWRRVLAGEDGLAQEVEIADHCFNFVYRRQVGVDSVFIYGSDVTRLKRTQDLLTAQKAQIAEMARFPEMNPGPVLRADRDGRIILANAAARDLFGGDALIGKCWTDLCPGLDRAAWEGILESPDIVSLEVMLGERCYLMAHRMNPERSLVFIYGNDVTSLRAAEAALRQAEKMATLGTLAAGVAHELNNPAAAAASESARLDAAISSLFKAAVALGRVGHSSGRAAALLALAGDARATGQADELSPVRRSELEGEVDALLDEHGVTDGWELAPVFVAAGYSAADLTRLADEWGEDRAAVLEWIGRTRLVQHLSSGISQSTRRVSTIVGTLKSYTFLDQSSIQTVDVVRGLEDTLTLFAGMLEHGVDVVREYARDVPLVEASGSELNQVWASLIHNAVEAMGGQGRLVVRVAGAGDSVVVEIEDDGPGIPAALQPRLFEAFVTTKSPGHGTGLGLASAWNVVTKKHGGTITFHSKPGCTCFVVTIPTRPQARR